jgi:hypothetical protein
MPYNGGVRTLIVTAFACAGLSACKEKQGDVREKPPADYELTPPITFSGPKMAFTAPHKLEVRFYLYDKKFWSGREPGDAEVQLFRGDETTPWCSAKLPVERKRGDPPYPPYTVDVACDIPPGVEFNLTGKVLYKTTAGAAYEGKFVFGAGEYNAAAVGDPLANVKAGLTDAASGLRSLKDKLPAPGSKAQPCDDKALESLTPEQRVPWAVDSELFTKQTERFDWINGLVFANVLSYEKTGSAYWDTVRNKLEKPGLVAIYHTSARRPPKLGGVDPKAGTFSRDPGAFDGSIVIVDWRAGEEDLVPCTSRARSVREARAQGRSQSTPEPARAVPRRGDEAGDAARRRKVAGANHEDRRVSGRTDDLISTLEPPRFELRRRRHRSTFFRRPISSSSTCGGGSSSTCIARHSATRTAVLSGMGLSAMAPSSGPGTAMVSGNETKETPSPSCGSSTRAAGDGGLGER